MEIEQATVEAIGRLNGQNIAANEADCLAVFSKKPKLNRISGIINAPAWVQANNRWEYNDATNVNLIMPEMYRRTATTAQKRVTFIKNGCPPSIWMQ
jgi:hypothetical protein